MTRNETLKKLYKMMEEPVTSDGKTFKEYNEMAMTGEIGDDFNPIYLFSLTSTKLLEGIVSGDIDVKKIAEIILLDRN